MHDQEYQGPIAIPMMLIFEKHAFIDTMVYAGLRRIADAEGVVNCPNKEIAAACSLSIDAVRRGLLYLQTHDYVSCKPPLSPSNPTRYNLYRLLFVEGDRALIPVQALNGCLRPSAFVVYCYMCWYYQRYGRRPQKSEICYTTGMGFKTVHKGVMAVEAAGLPLDIS